MLQKSSNLTRAVWILNFAPISPGIYPAFQTNCKVLFFLHALFESVITKTPISTFARGSERVYLLSLRFHS